MKILVIAGTRTGSSMFCAKLAKDYDLPFFGELGNVVPRDSVSTPTIDSTKSPEQIFTFLKNEPNWVCKLIPRAARYTVPLVLGETPKKNSILADFYKKQIPEQYRMFDLYTTAMSPKVLAEFYKDLFDMADEVYYLYRKDFVAQVKSMAIAITTTDFSPNRAVDKHINVPVNVIHQAYGDVMANWMIVKDLYQCFPSKVIALEDTDITGPGQTKYPAYNNLHGNFFLIRDFDVAQHVFGISERRLR